MHITTRTITTIAAFTALEIVLSRLLSFNVWNMKIGFSFVAVVLAAMLLGPISAAVVAGLGDLLGAILFPIGPYFPGFTLTALLTGLCFGLILRRTPTVWRIALAVTLKELLLGLLLNTLWISILNSSPYLPLLMTRLVQCAIMLPVELFTIMALRRILPYIERRVCP